MSVSVASLLVILWMLGTGQVLGWPRLRTVAMAPGEMTITAVSWVVRRTLNPVQRKGLQVNARLAWTRYRCWRLGVNTKNPR